MLLVIVGDMYILHSPISQQHFVPVCPWAECGELYFTAKYIRQIWSLVLPRSFTHLPFSGITGSIIWSRVYFKTNGKTVCVKSISARVAFHLLTNYNWKYIFSSVCDLFLLFLKSFRTLTTVSKWLSDLNLRHVDFESIRRQRKVYIL